MDPMHAFTYRFRTGLSDRLEYSFDESWNDWGIMVGGKGPSFVDDVARFLRTLPYAAEMQHTVARVHGSVHPVRYLFRVNADPHQIHTVSLYFRLPDEALGTLERACAAISPLRWQGPDLHDVANVLETPPEGLGLRMRRDGQGGVAAYFRVNRSLPAFRLRTVDNLIQVCGFSSEIAREINADIPLIYDRTHVGVIGLDGGTDGQVRTLKLDPANVPFSMARAFLQRKGAQPERLNALAAFGRSVRMPRVSYIGLKYNASGFSGWKVYWSMQPLSRRAVSSPSMVLDQPILSPSIKPPVFVSTHPKRSLKEVET